MAAPDTHPTQPHDDCALVRGWTRERMTRFLDHLAEKGNVRAACGRVGLSRETAYRLRRRDPLFARGWAAAMVKAHDVTTEVLADRAIDGVEEPIYHRGELVGTRRRYDSRLLLAHIARLDKVLEDEAALADAARFDELLARIAGAELPEAMDSDDGVLPLERERLALRWGEYACAAHRELYDVEDEDEETFDEAAFADRMDEEVAAYRRGLADGERQWDKWFDGACGLVDHVTGRHDELPVAGLPGGPPLPAREGEAGGAFFEPRTVSDVSTGALARGPTGAAEVIVTAPPLRSARHGMP